MARLSLSDTRWYAAESELGSRQSRRIGHNTTLERRGDDRIGIRYHATASRAGIELGSASVGGVFLDWSDITRSDGTEYLDETACDLIPEAIADAAESLARLQTGDTK